MVFEKGAGNISQARGVADARITPAKVEISIIRREMLYSTIVALITVLMLLMIPVLLLPNIFEKTNGYLVDNLLMPCANYFA